MRLGYNVTSGHSNVSEQAAQDYSSDPRTADSAGVRT